MTNRCILILSSVTMSVGSGWAVAQHAVPPPAKVRFVAETHTLPFELFRGNRVIVQVVFNGRPTEALLDTGASATVVDEAYARAVGMPRGRKVTARGAGGIVEAETLPGNRLELGGMKFEDMTVGVMDLGIITRSMGRPVNIVVGRDFFNNAVVSIDWSAAKLTISPPDSFKPAPGAVAIQLKANGPFNTIPVSVAGDAAIDALLDLGNGGALSLPRTYWGKRPALSSLRFAEGRRGGVGGLHPARNATIPTVTLAGRTFHDVPATLSEGGNDHEPALMANVGIGLLKQFHVDLDLGRGQIYLTPRPDAPPFERDRSGARIDLVGDRLKVVFVSAQGPAAAAGLREGDEIIAVDGKKITADYYRDGDWARGPAGTPVVLLRADGSRVTVTLRDYY